MEISEAQSKTLVPDLQLPRVKDIVLIQRREEVKEVLKARWIGTSWIFQAIYPNGDVRWIQETGEEGTYREIEVQPSEEPIETVSGTTGPIP